MNVLVVEDEERIASFLAKGLRAHGYDVEWVQSGEEALERAADERISLMIPDLGLPDLDGLEVLGKLRGSGVDVPTLVLSARARVDDRVAGLDLGADDYLVKPFAFEELLARVRANLRPRVNRTPDVLLKASGISLNLLEREVTVGAAVCWCMGDTGLAPPANAVVFAVDEKPQIQRSAATTGNRRGVMSLFRLPASQSSRGKR
jgi:DNA-binding response OmpR family regulator